MLSAPARPVDTTAPTVVNLPPRGKPVTDVSEKRHSYTDSHATRSSRSGAGKAPPRVNRVNRDPPRLEATAVDAQNTGVVQGPWRKVWRLFVGDGEDRGDGFDDLEDIMKAYPPPSSHSMYYSGVADRLAMEGTW